MTEKPKNQSPNPIFTTEPLGFGEENPKKKKPIKLDKSVDINKIKNKLLLENQKLREEKLKSENFSLLGNHDNYDTDYRYESLSKQYMNEVYGVRVLSFIVRIINSSHIPKELEQNYPLHTIMLKICRYLLLNELELSVYCLYLDRLGWINQEFELDDNLFIIGIIAKMQTCTYAHIIINALYKEIKGLEQTFDLFIKLKMERAKYDILTLSIKEVNDTYELISKPFNLHCKENFVDYNFCVDQILSMSLPYSDHKKINKKALNEGTGAGSVNITVSERPVCRNFILSDDSINRNSAMQNLIRNNPFMVDNQQQPKSNIIVPSIKVEDVLMSNTSPNPAQGGRANDISKDLIGKYSSFIDKHQKSYTSVYDLPLREISNNQFFNPTQSLAKNISASNEIFPNIRAQLSENVDMNAYMNFYKNFEDQGLNKEQSLLMYKIPSKDALSFQGNGENQNRPDKDQFMIFNKFSELERSNSIFNPSNPQVLGMKRNISSNSVVNDYSNEPERKKVEILVNDASPVKAKNPTLQIFKPEVLKKKDKNNK